jgi:glycosyltransferase involved in cell wall biosynthesis
VVVVRTAPSSTGPGRYAREIARALGPAAELVSLLIDPRIQSQVEDSRTVAGVRTGVYPVDAGFNSWSPRWAFRSLRAEWGAAGRGLQVVHYTALDVPPLASPATEVVSILDSPKAYFETGLYRARRRYRFTLRRRLPTYRRFRHVLALSDHVRRALVEDGFDGDVQAIPPPAAPAFRPGGDRDALRRSLGLPTDQTLLLSISSDEPRKNLESVRRTVEALGSSARLVRVGPSLPGAITFPGVDETTLAQLYRACDLLLFPTLEEGFGLPVVEAFASGLPVVASRIEVVEEVADGAARLADPTDIPGLVQGVRDVLADPAAWRARGLARSAAFTVERFRERIQTYYRNLGVSLPILAPTRTGSP